MNLDRLRELAGYLRDAVRQLRELGQPSRELFVADPRVTNSAKYLLIVLSGTARAQQPSAAVAGTVSVTAPDGQSMFLPGVTLTLTCPGAPERKEVSNEQGAFRFDNVSAGSGECAIVADLEGFRSSTRTLTLKTGDSAAVALELGLDTLQEDVTVRGNADAPAAWSAPAGRRPLVSWRRPGRVGRIRRRSG